MAGWSPRKKFFVKFYTGRHFLNAGRSAVAAGYKSPTTGSRLLKDPLVVKAIARRLQSFAAPSEEVLARLSHMARGSIEPFLKLNNFGEVELDLSSKAAQHNLGLIKKIKQKKTVTRDDETGATETDIFTEIELHDAKDANVQLAKAYGMFTEKDKEGNPLQPLYKVYVGVDPDAI